MDIKRSGAPQKPEDGPSLLNPQQLLPGVDYLYCAECGHHIGCIRLQPGVWEVQCSRCVGECGLCGCSANGICRGKDGSPVQTHMYVVDSSKKRNSVDDLPPTPEAKVARKGEGNV